MKKGDLCIIKYTCLVWCQRNAKDINYSKIIKQQQNELVIFLEDSKPDGDISFSIVLVISTLQKNNVITKIFARIILIDL